MGNALATSIPSLLELGVRSKSGEGWFASARTRHPLFVVTYLLANRKWYRDYAIAQTVVAALEKLKLKWLKPKEDLLKIKIV